MPLAKARATGADRKNPARFADRREPNSEQLGNPSPHLSELQRKAWQAFTREAHWLKESDRALVEVASILRASLWSEFDVKTIGQLRLCLSAMGLTPTTRSKIAIADEPEADPSEEFYN